MQPSSFSPEPTATALKFANESTVAVGSGLNEKNIEDKTSILKTNGMVNSDTLCDWIGYIIVEGSRFSAFFL